MHDALKVRNPLFGTPDAELTDEFAGQGGSYILDLVTGKRTRVEEPTQGSVRPGKVVAGKPSPIDDAAPAAPSTGRQVRPSKPVEAA